ncbi:transporter substrate-binding domain-containing protein [Neorhizobium sp. CSC1952]|uniref:substrate-binding periplasmic protein n=1 Tax=Neorhizobium sp. CSC1952 TaxID=2978974 RepID=UPI0025A5B8E4|nr:transporter substrate-binding domain-containing protein [Rhizobium sp. CSC1952]WJR68814.1 transporter substrate-binding domain-containing protein [Rhizobium sp. CSC1952]
MMKRFLQATVAAAVLAMSAVHAPALAQDASTFNAVLGETKGYQQLPKPWKFRALVNPGKLTIGTTGASPPRTFVDPATSKLTGSYVELFTKLAQDLDLQPEFVQLEWAGILPGLAANRFDIACDGASWTAERLASDQFLMTSPTAVNATVAVTRKDTNIKTFADAKSADLGGVRGEVYFEGAKKALPDAAATEFPGMQESLIGLQNGQVKLVAMNLSNALNVLNTAPNKAELQLVGPALQVFPQGLCVNPKQPDLLIAINTLLGNYRADGTLKNLVVKYGGSAAEVDALTRIGY